MMAKHKAFMSTAAASTRTSNQLALNPDEDVCSKHSMDLPAILIAKDLNQPNADPRLKCEAYKLLQEVEKTIKEVEESRFYAKLSKQLKSCSTIQCNMSRLLAHESQLPMVIYGLGSMEFCFKSHYQLAIAILLKRDFPHWIGNIEVFDPVLSPADIVVLENFGCTVLSMNERFCRHVERPTLFYIPYPVYPLLGNLLDSNWHPSRVNQIVLLTNKLSTELMLSNKYKERLDDHYMERLQYPNVIQKYTTEVEVNANYGGLWDDIFFNFAWHFFNVDSHIDMENLLPGEPSKEVRVKNKTCEWEAHDFKHLRGMSERIFTSALFRKSVVPHKNICHDSDESSDGDFDGESSDGDPDDESEKTSRTHGVYRVPYWMRCKPVPPPPECVKLSISGRGYDARNNTPAGFGGIFHNDCNIPLAVFSGSLGGADMTAAGIKALKHGLRCLEYMDFTARRLLVVGDDLTVIRWAYGLPEPPARLQAGVREIVALLKSTDAVVYNVYEETNFVAAHLAKRGSMRDLPLPLTWIAAGDGSWVSPGYV